MRYLVLDWDGNPIGYVYGLYWDYAYNEAADRFGERFGLLVPVISATVLAAASYNYLGDTTDE